MEIHLATEHAYYLIPPVGLDIARDRVEQKKMSLAGGMLGTLFSRSKPEELQFGTVESRLEPFWLVEASSVTSYDRSSTYTIPASGADVRSVTLLGQDLSAAPQSKGMPSFQLAAVEHCTQELETRQTFDGLSGAKADFLKHAAAARTEIADLDGFAPQGFLVVPPQVRASAVARQATADVTKPVKNAQSIRDERVDISVLDLYFRPLFTFEYEWVSKNKKVLIEYDPLVDGTRTGGKKFTDQFKGIVTRDLLFDVTADAFGTIVPGGGIAVKLVKAVVDRRK
jgi:hypothetical protein